MKQLFVSLQRHQFFTLSTGVVTAQILSLAFMPILTRSYPVESFGYFAIYLAFTTLVGIFSTLRLEMAIPIASDQTEADQMSTICCLMTAVVGVLLLGLFAPPLVRELLPSMDQRYGTWVLVSVSAACVGWVQVITQRILRNGKLKFISARHIVDKGSFLLVALVAAKLDCKHNGLILAQTVGTLLSVAVLFAGAAWAPKIELSNLKVLLVKYSDFPRFNSLSMALQLASNQLPILIYSRFFPAHLLGFLNLAQRFAEAPNTIVTSGLGTVFYRRVLSAPPEAYRRIYLRALLWCLLTIVLPAIAVSFYAEPLIKFVFGAQWGASTPYFVALIPLTVARVCFTLQQGLLFVTRRLDIDLRISALVLLAQILGMSSGALLTETLLGPVIFASALSTVIYGYSLILIYQLVSSRPVTALE